MTTHTDQLAACREAFEQKFPAPIHIHWNSHIGEYYCALAIPDRGDLYRHKNRWEAWQACWNRTPPPASTVAGDTVSLRKADIDAAIEFLGIYGDIGDFDADDRSELSDLILALRGAQASDAQAVGDVESLREENSRLLQKIEDMEKDCRYNHVRRNRDNNDDWVAY